MAGKASVILAGIGPVKQKPYIRKDGKLVQGTTRSKPGTVLDKNGQLKKPKFK